MATGMSKTIGGSPQERSEILDDIQSHILLYEKSYSSKLGTKIYQTKAIISSILRENLPHGLKSLIRNTLHKIFDSTVGNSFSKEYSNQDRKILINKNKLYGIYKKEGLTIYFRFANNSAEIKRSDPHKNPKTYLKFIKILYNQIIDDKIYKLRFFDIIGVTENILAIEYIKNPITIEDYFKQSKNKKEFEIVKNSFNKLKEKFDKGFFTLGKAIKNPYSGLKKRLIINGEDFVIDYDFSKKNILFDGFDSEGIPEFILMDVIAIN